MSTYLSRLDRWETQGSRHCAECGRMVYTCAAGSLEHVDPPVIGHLATATEPESLSAPLSPSEPTTMRCPQCDTDRPVREHLGRHHRVLGHCGHVITLTTTTPEAPDPKHSPIRWGPGRMA